MGKQNGPDFSSIIQVLASLREQAIAQLRSPDTRADALQKKLEIDRVLDVLSQAARLGLSGREETSIMPDTRNPFAEYRVLDDHEAEEPEYWTEVVAEGEPLRLQPGDIILRRRTDR